MRDVPTEPGVINFPIVIMTSALVISPDNNNDSTQKKKRKDPNGQIAPMVLELDADPDKLSKKSETEIDRDIENRWKELFNLKIKFPECKKLNVNDFVL
mmetsp:Transcript_17661/g.25888  ORF Transcript_17661/g.25888 Transcript_17661/m.25888 type:complete len:99 (-) Transcript_17661:181-477(-)